MNFSDIIKPIIIVTLSFSISSLCVPLLIKLAIKKRLFAEKGGRHIHSKAVPKFGGFAIFIGFIFSQAYFILDELGNNNITQEYFLLIFCVGLLFILGAIDDLVEINATLKFLIQNIVAVILVFQANIQITSFFGLFGINELMPLFSIIFSIAVIVFFINAYNLIDGIDGLSSSIGIFVVLCFGSIFIYNGYYTDAILCCSVFAAMFGFWLYNKPPAKIFLGDSGSLSIGLILAYFAIKISNIPIDNSGTISPVFAMIVLVYPVIDTLRVFTIRILKGISPFTPDKNHIHHSLLELEFSHGKATIIILIFSITLTIIAFSLRKYPNFSFFTLVPLVVLASEIPNYLLRKKSN